LRMNASFAWKAHSLSTLNSHLSTVEFRTNQPHPVILVIGIFPEEDGRATDSAKQEFADVRWMEITSVLRRESANGTKPVRQIEFAGERLDLASVRRWREKVIAG